MAPSDEYRRWREALTALALVGQVGLVVAAGVVGVLTQMASLDAMTASQGTPMPPGMRTGMMTGVAVMGGVFALVLGWALPVFFLIWFSRSAIKAETAEWTDSRDHGDFGPPSSRINRNEM